MKFTIASLLDMETDKKIIDIWNHLEEKCAINGIKLTKKPHITWVMVEGINEKILEEKIKNISKKEKIFRIFSSGLGIFCNEKIIIYNAIISNQNLLDFQSNIWKEINKEKDVNIHYEPGKWVPHITLANKDVDQTNIGCVIKELSEMSYEYAIPINNLAILYDNQGELGIKSVHKLIK